MARQAKLNHLYKVRKQYLLMKKIKQSYWKLKPSKLPIWKQRNDDNRLGMHFQPQPPLPQQQSQLIRSQPMQVARPAPPIVSQPVPAMPKSSLPHNAGVPAPSYMAPKGLPTQIITKNPNYGPGIPMRPTPIPPRPPVVRPPKLPVKPVRRPSLY